MNRFSGSNPAPQYRVDVWQERDRLSIVVSDEWHDGKTVAEWWDDDARSMVEDGFFNPRHMGQSVMDYLADMGTLPAGASFIES
jgi:hypothetical protein